MWIKTQEGSIVNANSIAEFAEFNGYVNAYFNDDTKIVIAAYKNNSVKARKVLNSLFNALVRDDAVFVVED